MFPGREGESWNVHLGATESFSLRLLNKGFINNKLYIHLRKQ